MSTHTSTAREDAVSTRSFTSPLGTDEILAATDRAGRRIPPLWPLDHFVAVNPFLGFTEQDFAEAAHRLSATWGPRLCMPREFYAEGIRAGRIEDRHLTAALEAARRRSKDGSAHLPVDAAALRRAASTGAEAPRDPLPSVSDAVGSLSGEAWTRWIGDRVSSWAGAYFDLGQASWPSPWKDLPPWQAWKAEAAVDRSPELMGVTGFRSTVAGLPEDPEEAVARMVRELDVPAGSLDLYLERILSTVVGWVAYVRWHVWESELREREDDRLLQLAAIRLAYEVALLRAFREAGADDAWTRARETLEAAADLPRDPGIEVDLVLHDAYELAFQEGLLRHLDEAQAPAAGLTLAREPDTEARPDVQAVFCIDVRSEIYRRALESSDEGIQTLGFAGFFGFPVEYVPLGDDGGRARCPVLLTPAAVVAETVEGPDVADEAEVTRRRRLRDAASSAWWSFKMGAVSCFGFVGPVGLAYVKKLVGDTLGLTRPVPHPKTRGLSEAEGRALGPTLTPGVRDGRKTGMALQDRIETAAGALTAMSLTDGFARVVVLAGHGSTVVNNPHATGLDCGACGGHTGEANARVAAMVFNDPEVRAGLVERGIEIPEETVFVAARHDTTLDRVELLDTDGHPASHAADLARLEARLAEAGRLARAERAPSLHIEEDVDRKVEERSRDWSQVRPEWGLAGCAAFVAAPRGRTKGLDLSGRAFLHDYVWQRDPEFQVLELIMSAPVVVASWISLQYYGSTVDNERLGSGNKTLHNVVGALGVLEGNAGDLRVGLPLQSVHDGDRFVHEPLRLNVIIEAPREAMSDILERHPDVRALLDNRWLHLWAMDDRGRVTHRYAGDFEWEAVDASALLAEPVGA
jgi:hypothetical protein